MKNKDAAKPQLAIALLAAGEATRFGSAKQLACYQGQTLITRAIALADSVASELLVITGAHHNAIYQHLSDIDKAKNVIFNQDWQQGMSSSIKAAVTHCPEHCAAIMFLTVDQIHITQQDVQSMIALWQQHRARIVCAQYAEQQGVPAIFPRSYFSSLLSLNDDKGAKQLIKFSPNVATVFMPSAELDIDTVQQLDEQNRLTNSC